MDVFSEFPFDPDFKKTLAFHLAGGPYGFFDPGSLWSIHLNIKEIRERGMYDEIYAHEAMHHQLTCSTTFGHAIQIVLALSRRMAPLEEMLRAFMDITWMPQEAAAMLSGFQVYCQNTTEGREFEVLSQGGAECCDAALRLQHVVAKNYLSRYHESYGPPFQFYRSLIYSMLSPDMWPAASVFANALSQFAMNTNILEQLSQYLAGEPTLSSEYLNAEANHPGRRLRRLIDEVRVDPLKAYTQLQELFAERSPEILDAGLTLVGMNQALVADGADAMRIHDWWNSVFLQWATRISGLGVSASHSYEVSSQYDALCARHSVLFERLKMVVVRLDLSRNPKRWQYPPSVEDIS